MDEKTMKMIVDSVVSEFQKQGGACVCRASDSLGKLLVIGSISSVPADLCAEYTPVGVDDYEMNHNIHIYEKVLITNLTLTQLSDIAQARDDSPEAGAVISALLNGTEVYILEDAYPHRRYAGKSSSRIYDVIENNVKLLQSFGIKTLKKDRCPAQPVPGTPAKYAPPPIEAPAGTACVNSERLITEDVARAMTGNGETAVTLARDSIITPSAWDVFRNRGVTVTKGEVVC